MRRLRAAPARRGDRAGHPAGARRLRGGRLPEPSRSAGDSARLAAVPRLARELPARRRVRPRRARVLRQPDLAATLEAIRDRGADGFYRGPVADLIVAEMERGGGLISHDDLAALPGRSGAIRSGSATAATPSTRMPPASSGGVTMGEILNIMEGLRPAAAVRLARAGASRGGGDAPRLHRSQHLAGRPGLRAATRSTGCSRRTTPPSSAASIGERATPTPAFDAGDRAPAPRPPTTRSWTPRATR